MRFNLKLTVAYEGTHYHGWQRQCAGNYTGRDIQYPFLQYPS